MMNGTELCILMIESATHSQRGAVARCERRLKEATRELQNQRAALHRMEAELAHLRSEWLAPIEEGA